MNHSYRYHIRFHLARGIAHRHHVITRIGRHYTVQGQCRIGFFIKSLAAFAPLVGQRLAANRCDGQLNAFALDHGHRFSQLGDGRGLDGRRFRQEDVVNERRVHPGKGAGILLVAPLKPIHSGLERELELLPVYPTGPFAQHLTVQGEIQIIPVLLGTDHDVEVTGTRTGFLFDHKNGFLRVFDLARAKGVAPLEHLNGLGIPRPAAGTAPARVGRDHARLKRR